MSDEEFAEKLLLRRRVAVVVPGSAFGAVGTGYLRATYCTAYNQLEEALVAYRTFLEEARLRSLSVQSGEHHTIVLLIALRSSLLTDQRRKATKTWIFNGTSQVC